MTPAVQCLRCHRPLTSFAVSIQTRAGPLGWGPKCARMAGQTVHKPRPAKAAQRTDDPAQVDWIDTKHDNTKDLHGRTIATV